MNAACPSPAPVPHEPWYKYGVAFLLIEMAFAIAVCGYSLYMTFHGYGGFPGKHQGVSTHTDAQHRERSFTQPVYARPHSAQPYQ